MSSETTSESVVSESTSTSETTSESVASESTSESVVSESTSESVASESSETTSKEQKLVAIKSQATTSSTTQPTNVTIKHVVKAKTLPQLGDKGDSEQNAGLIAGLGAALLGALGLTRKKKND
ncbi:hypothetical protein LEQ_0101c [Ligilactobacillus equi DPC 6820]|uniref:Gram-positive cocci surface proteins LPxTG domain-containing protein n=1 Tax=Ligilactobacillus equi DPC 6820 TaxID=1392007 RepID=V7HXN2_9LACO|nr:hypothetical protein LEQ_0101c [Ligilactobacillus equi DPC 6820]